MRSLVSAILIYSLATCTTESQEVVFEVGNARYQIPARHIVKMTLEPHQFVRIKPTQHTFELIHDSRTIGSTDSLGWPAIFSLNDERAPDIERHDRGNLAVVCRVDVSPTDGCGLKVIHRGVEWSVLFPREQLGAAAVIRERAVATLGEYEVQDFSQTAPRWNGSWNFFSDNRPPLI